MKRIIKQLAFVTVLTALLAALSGPVLADIIDPLQKELDDNIDLSLVFSTETDLVVYVDGEWSDSLSGSYVCGEMAQITAPSVSGKVFSHWEADGSIVSYSNPLNLTMNAHTTLHAVYTDTAPTAQSVAGFTSITRLNDGGDVKIMLQAIADSGSNGTVTGAGIVYSTTVTGEGLKIGNEGVTNAAAERISASTTIRPDSILDRNNCWMLQIIPGSNDTAYHVRAYVTTGSGTTYGDEKTVKLSDTQSGISKLANLTGYAPDKDVDGILRNMIMSTNTVTFYPNGADGEITTQVGMSGQKLTLNANTYTRSGRMFDGWNTKEDGSGTSYVDEAEVTLADDVKLYAQWKSKEKAVVTKAPVAKTPVSNGTAQALVTEGTASGGTLQYALGTSGTTAPTDILYSKAIPEKTDIGTYYVWYKAVGDDDHTDSIPVCLTVNITADKTQLNAAIKEAETFYNTISENSIYADIASTLNEAITKAKETAQNSTATVEAVTSAKDAVTTAKTTAENAKKDVDDKKAADTVSENTASANKVTDKINALPETDKVKTSDKEAIEEARKAYDDLTADQKKIVDESTLKKLTDAEAALKTAVEAEEKKAADEKAAKAAADKINALPVSNQVKTTDKAAIEAARKTYNDLTADQKKNVDAATLKKLTDAEAALKAAVEAEAKKPTTTPGAGDKKTTDEKPTTTPGAGGNKPEDTDKVIVDSAKGTFEITEVPADKSQTGTVTYKAVPDKKADRVVIPATITKKGKTYKVVAVDPDAFNGSKATIVVIGQNIKTISPKAFKKSKVKKIIVKSKKLKRKTVKNALRGCKSKGIIVRVNVGSNKENKEYAKKYRRFFSKKNVGKKVKVKGAKLKK